MAVEASSNYALAREAMKAMVANCATFQTWTNSGNAEAAKSWIHHIAISDANWATTKPRVLITCEDWGGEAYAARGTFRLTFGCMQASQENEYLTNQQMEMLNNVGEICEELSALSAGATGDYLLLRGLPRIDEEPSFSTQASESAHRRIVMCVLVDFGLEEGA